MAQQKPFDPLDTLASNQPASKPAPTVRGPTAVEDAAVERLLRAVLQEQRDSRAELAEIKRSSQRTAFYVTLLGFPTLIALVLLVLAFFFGVGRGILGR